MALQSSKAAGNKQPVSATYPQLAAEWHPTRNGELRPENVTAGSNKKVWWQCGDGHEWQAAVASRSRGGAGCPYCSGRRATPSTCLAATRPDVAQEWHPTKNRE